MTTALDDPRLVASFSGTHEGVTYRCVPHRYGSSMVLSLTRANSDGWKDRASWLAEALGGKWARGHQEGFRIAKRRALQWRILFLGGWDGNVPMFPTTVNPVSFSLGDGPKMTLKEAISKALELTPL